MSFAKKMCWINCAFLGQTCFSAHRLHVAQYWCVLAQSKLQHIFEPVMLFLTSSMKCRTPTLQGKRMIALPCVVALWIQACVLHALGVCAFFLGTRGAYTRCYVWAFQLPALITCPISSMQRKFRNLTSDCTESCRRRSINQDMGSRSCDAAEMCEVRKLWWV